MRFAQLLAAAAMLTASVAARADIIDTSANIIYDFDLNANLEGGGTVTGTLTIYPITGSFGAAVFNAEVHGNIYDGLTINGVVPAPVGVNAYFIVTSDENITPEQRGTEFFLYLPVGTLTDYSGSEVCSTSNPCGPPGNYVSSLQIAAGYRPVVTSGTLELVLPPGASPVPEPSGLVLLGTGVLGGVGAVRRRWGRTGGRRLSPTR